MKPTVTRRDDVFMAKISRLKQVLNTVVVPNHPGCGGEKIFTSLQVQLKRI